MTSSCKTIITNALSKLGVSGATKAPRQADLDLGLQTLQALVRSWIGSGLLGRANPVTPTGDYVARENDRIFRTSEASTVSIILPELVSDRLPVADLDCRFYDYPCSTGRMRPPREGSFVVINDATSGNSVEYIYDSYRNQWISVHDLSLQEGGEVLDSNGLVIAVNQPSLCPLSSRDANGLAALLATKLADHHAATLAPTTVRDAQAWLSMVANRFGEPERQLSSEMYWDTYR